MKADDFQIELDSFQSADGRFSECYTTPEMVDVFVDWIRQSDCSGSAVYSAILRRVAESEYWQGLILLVSKLVAGNYCVGEIRVAFDALRDDLVATNVSGYFHALAIFGGAGHMWAMEEIRRAESREEFSGYREEISRCISAYSP